MVKAYEDVRSIIVNVARELFAKFGFKKTTMDDIAREAHKGKSSLYHYFGSKEDVFQAVLEKEICIFNEEISKALNKEDSPLKQIRAYVLTRTRVIKRLANYYSAIKDDYFEHHGFIEKFRIKSIEDEVKTITKVLEGGIDKGIFNIKELEMTAFVFVTALKGIEYSWVVKISMKEIEKRIDNLLEVLFYGIIKR